MQTGGKHIFDSEAEFRLRNVISTMTTLPYEELKKMYAEPHRRYHTLEHILDMVKGVLSGEPMKKSDELELVTAIAFHGIIYDTRNFDNEKRSADFMVSKLQPALKNVGAPERLHKLVMSTHDHVAYDDLSRRLIELDLWIINHGSFADIMDMERKMQKEYQYHDWLTYKNGRLLFLKTFQQKEAVTYTGNLEFLHNYLTTFTPRIGLYAGSFNPFHRGHWHTLKKAESIFDKVIIAQGNNPFKTDDKEMLPSQLSYHQTMRFDGLLTDLIEQLGYSVTLVRGLRNATDLQEEMTNLRFMEDLKPDIQVVYIASRREDEHISSKAVRFLQTTGKHGQYLIGNDSGS